MGLTWGSVVQECLLGSDLLFGLTLAGPVTHQTLPEPTNAGLAGVT